MSYSTVDTVLKARNLQNGKALDAWTADVDVRHLKGYQNPTNRSYGELVLRPVNKIDNLHLETKAYILALLIGQGRLREVGTRTVIRTMQDLTDSKAAVLEGFGGPLIQHTKANGETGYMQGNFMNHALKGHAQAVGLPGGGLHAFRRDVAQEMSVMLGQDAARPRETARRPQSA